MSYLRRLILLLFLSMGVADLVLAQIDDWSRTVVDCLDGNIPGGSFLRVIVYRDSDATYKMCIGPDGEIAKKWKCLKENVIATKLPTTDPRELHFSFEVPRNSDNEYANLKLVIKNSLADGNIKFNLELPFYFLGKKFDFGDTFAEIFNLDCEINRENIKGI